MSETVSFGYEEVPAAEKAAIRQIKDRAVTVAFSRAGKLHPLGLFTLHSVWRI